MKHWFITGTDTDVGKTYVTALLMQALQQRGQTCVGYKPISAGCEQTEQGLRNEDALVLQAHSSVDVPYDLINPIAFEPPIAPHIAAKEVSKTITLDSLVAGADRLSEYTVDHVITEGAGGWRLPLGNGEFLSQLAVDKAMKVILVVELKLGCLNHACLTAEAIINDGLTLAGWVANGKNTDMLVQQENIQGLKDLIPAPLLGVIPHDDGTIEKPWTALDITPLLSSIE